MTGAEHVPAARPPRTWRPMVAWTLGILAALGLAWFVGAVAVPFFQVRAVVRRYDDGPVTTRNIERLGGPKRAATKIAMFVRLPRWVTSSTDRYCAARLLALTDQWDLSCEVYRTTHHPDVMEGLFPVVFSPLMKRLGTVTKADILNRYGPPDHVDQDGSRFSYSGSSGGLYLGFDKDGRLKSVDFVESCR